jgi:hypothetical protein
MAIDCTLGFPDLHDSDGNPTDMYDQYVDAFGWADDITRIPNYIKTEALKSYAQLIGIK